MRRLFRLATVFVMIATQLWQWQFSGAEAAAPLRLDKTKVEFASIEGWARDDHAAAFVAFRKSCQRLLAPKTDPKSDELVITADPAVKAVCEVALLLHEKLSRDESRQFFEANFTPYLVKRVENGGMLTGYFEPEIKGSLTPTKEFPVPIYAKPDDLTLLTSSSSDRAKLPADLTAARLTPEGPKPYYTRKEIDEGVLKGRGLEIAYVSDAYDAFVMQVQGSGLIRLTGGKTIRVGFAAKNGHPYTSIGKLLIERGALMAESTSMQSVMNWLRSDPQRGREVMWENKSYPFFQRLNVDAPQGSMALPLFPGRSLAVDPRYHRMGMPIWVAAPELKDMQGKRVQRLMIAHDTGSAIRGPVRGDFFWGSGPVAGKFAGETKHLCDFYVFVPK